MEVINPIYECDYCKDNKQGIDEHRLPLNWGLLNVGIVIEEEAARRTHKHDSIACPDCLPGRMDLLHKAVAIGDSDAPGIVTESGENKE